MKREDLQVCECIEMQKTCQSSLNKSNFNTKILLYVTKYRLLWLHTKKKVRHCCDSYQLLLLLSGSFRLKVLTLQVDEEGAMVQQSLWIQVSRHLCGQVDPSCHHQLSQLGGGGGGLLLERLEVKWMMAGVYILYILKTSSTK